MWLRLALFVLTAAGAGLGVSWLAGEISYRLGYTRAWGREVAASAGTALLAHQHPPKVTPDA